MPIHDWTRVDAGIFHDFHNTWISELKRALNGGILPDGYYALSEQVAGDVTPDVLTLQAAGEGTEAPANGPAGAMSALVVAPEVRITARALNWAYAAKRRTLSIRHTTGDRVVALIEVLSPGNKS